MSDDSALFCNCEDPELAMCPCSIHAPEQYKAWLLVHAPRVCAAEEANDPLVGKYTDAEGYESYPPAGEMEEFSALRSALSGFARDQFDEVWELERKYGEWPERLESVLHIRDEWASLILPTERQAVREEVKPDLGAGQYPFATEDVFSGEGPAPIEDLKAEVEGLAQIAKAALYLKSMIEDHIRSQDPQG